MNKTLSLMIIAALALPACSSSKTADDVTKSVKIEPVVKPVKPSEVKVRGVEDLSAGPLIKKYDCQEEFVTESKHGKFTNKHRMFKTEKISKLADGKLLKEMEESRDGQTFRASLEYDQIVGQDGWITESGVVHIEGETLKFKEVFRFDGDSRVTKEFAVSPKPKGADVRENHKVTIVQVSPTEQKLTDVLVMPYQVPEYVNGQEDGAATVIKNDQTCDIILIQ